MKVLVTGATGFVGRHVIPRLIEQGHAVTAVARDEAKARDFSWFDRVRFVACDIHRPIDKPDELFGKPEVVIHLAWPGLPNYKALVHYEEALPADYRFLKMLVEGGVDRLLVTGTCFEYGMQSGALSESLPTQPTNPYGYAKDALRRQLEFLRSAHPFALTWARLFYLYGEGQPDTSLYPQLRNAALRGDEVFNMSGGEQLRDYLPVDEVARLIVELAVRRCDTGAINICVGKPVSVRSLVEGWLRENGWPITLKLGHYPYPDYEPMAFWGDRRYLDSLIGTG